MPKIKLLIKVDEGAAKVEWKVWIKNGWVYHKQKPNAKQIQAYLANLAETLGKVINPPELHVKGDECKTQPTTKG